MLEIIHAHTPECLGVVAELIDEYAASLDFDLCFQDYEKELHELPGAYAPPSGRLLLARFDARVAGCVALHALDERTCEMKRLYARPEFRGRGVGRALVIALLDEARAIGYEVMRLDTVAPKMREAVKLYESLGFYQIPPYRPNPIDGAKYMEIKL